MSYDFKSVLLQKAENDLGMARALLESKPAYLEGAAFHVQQCMEKYLKVFLMSHQIDPLKTHNLAVLTKMCADIEPTFIVFMTPLLLMINNFAVTIRYDEVPGVDRDMITEAIISATQLKDFVLERLNSAIV